MVVTRFAPSPTGYLHIGGARTALFCWLMARHNKGKMILRIEDTDQKRNTQTATQQVIEDLRWLGIEWDEGPDVGGPNGPYLQSQRLDIYDHYCKKLLDAGKAYYCFDTADELQAMRQQAETKGNTFTYRRPKDFPDKAEVERARAAGRSVTVRFAVPQDVPLVVKDAVRGDVTFAAGEISDFIIQKSDGFPTYNYACVIDDELMNITHVIRGQEHLMNTPGQQALQRALGFKTPVYAHMSVTVSESGGKLSKREQPQALRKAINGMPAKDIGAIASAGGISAEEVETFIAGQTTPDIPAINTMAKYLGIELPEINIVDFMKSGYLPEAMVNFVALLGWSPGGKQEIMSAEELIAAFDLGRLTKTNSLFDRKKLVAFNTEHIRMLGPERLLGHFKQYLKTGDSLLKKADDVLLTKLIAVNHGARTLADIERKSRFLFVDNGKVEYDMKAVEKVLLKDNGIAMLSAVRKRLAAIEEITEENIERMLRSLAEESGVGLGKVAQPLRVAICGNTISPPIFDSVQMLGKENTLARIDAALKKFGPEIKGV